MLAMWILLAAMGATPSHGQVTKLLRANIGIYDEAGNLVERLPKEKAPRPPLRVKYRNDMGHLGVEWQGKVIYLRSSEVLTEGVPDPCHKPASTNRPAGSHIAAPEGIAAGVGGSSASCPR